MVVNMDKNRTVLTCLVLLILCWVQGSSAAQTRSLAEARRGFKTVLRPINTGRDPVEQPPRNLFRVVKYPSESRDLAAYISPNPNDGKKHPAIIWITGGDCNSIGDVWKPAPDRKS